MDEWRGGDFHLAIAGFADGALHGDGRVVAHGGAQRRAHRHAKRHAQQLQQVACRLARRRIEKLPGGAVEIDDAIGAVHHHGGRAVVFEQRALNQQRRGWARSVGILQRLGVARSFVTKPQVRGVCPAGKAQLRGTRPAIDAPLLADHLEQVLGAVERFGVAEEQIAAIAQREVQQRKNAALRLRLQIDEQVAAGADVDARERRIAQHVLRREHHHVAYFFLHAIDMFVLVEESIEPLGGHVRFDAAGVDARARQRQGTVGGVGGENLHVDVLAAGELFGDEHRQRVGLFATGAGADPATDGLSLLLRGDQRHDDADAQRFPGIGVTEKARDVDHQVVGQRAYFVGAAAQDRGVVTEIRGVDQPHAPLDASQQRCLAIAVEVVFGSSAQDGEDLAQVGTIELQRVVSGERFAIAAERITRVADHHAGNVTCFEHLVCIARVDEAAWHAGECCGFGLLGDADSARRLDGLRASRSIRAGAGQNDGHGLFILLGSQRTEEVVHRPAMPALLHRSAKPEGAVLDRERLSRRDDVGVVGFYRHAIVDFPYRDVCAPAEDFT